MSDKTKSMGMVGKKHSPEAKALMAEAQKRRWDDFYRDNPEMKGRTDLQAKRARRRARRQAEAE
jgi:hypothetical protein